MYPMAAANLDIPSIAPFKTKGKPTSVDQRWEKWLKQFQYFVHASVINTNNRKKALLLHLIRTNSQDIFETLTPPNATDEAALEALNMHFAVTKNLPYERSKLNQARQEASENINQFITKLRKLALTCEYGDNTDDQIRDCVIASCYSSKLSTKLLSEHKLALNRVSGIGRTRETAKYNTKSIKESKHSQSTEHTDSSDSIHRITQQKYKNRKTFPQLWYNSSRPSVSSRSGNRNPHRNSPNHNHHPQFIIVVDVVEQRDIKL